MGSWMDWWQEELEGLNAQARELEAMIAANVAGGLCRGCRCPQGDLGAASRLSPGRAYSWSGCLMPNPSSWAMAAKGRSWVHSRQWLNRAEANR